ncbi:MAG: amino acid ABC transporter ATP-binding protein [Weeping tea tree witches'-broom phytoplasma]|uniref:amino acid ABC transporter ATP-binding protein n=1 Tax=Candidatus Phytoplasma melaleucae TaxID=2982630 RepID=UPI00293AF86E|nr:amino acid ABC transporter ATP-binding protein [Weeping tea tree witches'-broom phytoplasma]
MNYLIEVQNLNKSFNNQLILKNINCKILKKEVITIIGRSGSGKSTFLRCLNLLEKPDSGKILINKINILKHNVNISHLRTQIGMVFQNFNLFDEKTVLENCCLAPIKVLKIHSKKAEIIARQKLKEVGMLNFINEKAKKLSGGQKQRVAIARTLCMTPQVILLDEPTSALDTESAQDILEILQKLVCKQQITLIIVTHELQFAKRVSSQIYFMENGKILERGTLHDIFVINKCPKIKSFFV